MRTTQHSIFLSEVIREVQQGKLVPAGMQRPYVWEKKHVEDFCRSIVDGFPIGSIFTWRPDLEMNEAFRKPRLGPVLPTETNPYFRLILDGQNRMATIAWMMGGKTPGDLSEAEKRVWAGDEVLVLDKSKQAMIFVPQNESEDGLRMPAHSLFSNGQATLREYWVRWEQSGYTEEEIFSFVELWSSFCDAFREARMVETCISEATPEEAKDAFLRICNTGVPISEEDFNAALNWMTE